MKHHSLLRRGGGQKRENICMHIYLHIYFQFVNLSSFKIAIIAKLLSKKMSVYKFSINVSLESSTLYIY